MKPVGKMRSNQQQITGDAHNFGKKTHRVTGLVLKYRNLTGEYLLLSNKSSLHNYINQLFHKICPGRSLLPALEVSPPDQLPSLSPQKMEWLELQPVNRPLTTDDFLMVGAVVALQAWAGLSDAHSENMVTGLDRDGRFVFACVDWETVFTRLNHPYEMGLFQVLLETSKGIVRAKSFGLSLVKDLVTSPDEIAAALKGHFLMAELLRANQTELMDSLQNSLELASIVRRVLLRKTEHYLNRPESKDYIPEEQEQLARGDVPYFFQIGDDPSIYWWKTETRYEKIHSSLPEIYCGPYRPPEYSDEFQEKIVIGLARSLAGSIEISRGQYQGLEIFLKKNSIVVLFEGRTFSGTRLLEHD